MRKQCPVPGPISQVSPGVPDYRESASFVKETSSIHFIFSVYVRGLKAITHSILFLVLSVTVLGTKGYKPSSIHV